MNKAAKAIKKQSVELHNARHKAHLVACERERRIIDGIAKLVKEHNDDKQ